MTYLKLRQKWFLAKFRKVTKWQLTIFRQMKMTTFFSTRTILSENSCHFVNLLKVDVPCKSFFSQIDKNHVITQLRAQRLLGFLNLQTDPHRFYKNAGSALFKICFQRIILPILSPIKGQLTSEVFLSSNTPKNNYIQISTLFSTSGWIKKINWSKALYFKSIRGYLTKQHAFILIWPLFRG